MTRPFPRDPLLAILAFGLLVRIAWALLIPVQPVSDSAAYDLLARNILQHGVFGFRPDEPSAYWAVGTPALLAATYAVLGETYWGIVVLNIAASLGTIIFAERLGTHYFDRMAGLCAAAVIAVWPNLILFTTIIASETFFIFFMVGGLWFWERTKGSAWVNTLATGLFWAAACYMRSIILLLPVALVIASAPGGVRATSLAAAKCVASILMILALVAPWTARNAQVFGTPVLVSTNFGANFWMGNNPDSTGDYMPLPEWVEHLNEVDRSDVLLEAAKAYIRDEPAAFLLRTGEKALLLHSWETIGVSWNAPAIEAKIGPAVIVPLKLVVTGYWFLVLGLALAGFATLIHSKGVWGIFHPAFVGWGYFTAIHAIIVAGDRYHMPSVPILALLAGLALARVAPRLVRSGKLPSPFALQQ